MRGKTFKYILLLATISITIIFLIQFAFLRSSYNYSDEIFRESASVAFKEVCYQLLLETGHTDNFENLTPVEIISSSTYLVNVDNVINKESLKLLLREELRKHDIFTSFEFAVYNPETEKMEDPLLIKGDEESFSDFKFPTNETYINYFAVHFPERGTFLRSGLSIWYFMTGLLIVVVLFFGYTLSVIVKQRRLSEAQKNFINNLTHELKTPISSIALSANVLSDENILKKPDRLFEYARIIEEQNKRLSVNVEKVLSLASLEKNRINLNLDSVDLNTILNKSVEEFKQTTFGRESLVDLQSSEQSAEILADRFHLSQMILNILENGAKYNNNTPKLSIRILHTKQNLHVSFADNGIGIPKDQRKKIFKKFYRVPTGNVHNVKGFGLGLDYVKKIIKAHKWNIRVDENPAGGSIFTLVIPYGTIHSKR